MTALLEESRREGWGPPQRQLDDDGLTEDDWDVVCQFFWLPHSHGPMVERLLEDFRWCLLNSIIDQQSHGQKRVHCSSSFASESFASLFSNLLFQLILYKVLPSRWCRDTAPAVRGWRRLTPGEQADTVDTWIDKAARVSKFTSAKQSKINCCR